MSAKQQEHCGTIYRALALARLKDGALVNNIVVGREVVGLCLLDKTAASSSPQGASKRQRKLCINMYCIHASLQTFKFMKLCKPDTEQARDEQQIFF